MRQHNNKYIAEKIAGVHYNDQMIMYKRKGLSLFCQLWIALDNVYTFLIDAFKEPSYD